jgi:hypothetical protein
MSIDLNFLFQFSLLYIFRVLGFELRVSYLLGRYSYHTSSLSLYFDCFKFFFLHAGNVA